MAKISAEEKKLLKGKGILSNKDSDNFSTRIITGNGVITASQARVVAEAAEKYGNGTLAFTTRLTIELPGVPYENLEPLSNLIATEGLKTGGTGPKVRPVVACKGTVCVHGLIDTQGLAKEIHDRFYEGYSNVKLPHKFKIGVGGCPNNCIKPDLNDLGIVGQRVPVYAKEDCRGCKKCTVSEGCPMGAASLQNGKIVLNQEICNNCGKCIDNCIFRIINEDAVGYKMYIGGRWGKKTHPGDMVDRLFSKEELMTVIEKAILLFREKGKPGERFSSTIERIGLSEFTKELLSDDVLLRKSAILA